ncbi:fimbrial protein [Pantoea sp. BAV 3049]|uniref:fimbrial protein n=1 Tax=Pantoea sp. BAV 3049 TaxID=2654188 RepID=UPI00131AA635|nr:fimbrial protein [Pantoea sp. BAV 3049]
MKKLSISAVLIFFFAVSITGQAEENMKFHGTLVSYPDCTINNNQPIEINFGNVGVNKVDGVNYTKDIDYNITCDGDADDAGLYISLLGTAVQFDLAAVESSVADLGIEIKNNDKPFTLGTQIKVDKNALPKLTAVPVKKDGAELSVGDFSATATLQAFYQ